MRVRSVVLSAALLGAGCTSGQVGTLPGSTTVPIASSKLQLAVGVATIATTSGITRGLNVVETFRNASGASATTTNTPTLGGPPGAFGDPTIAAVTGLTLPQQADAGGQIAKGTQVPAAPFDTTTNGLFGNTTGAFGYGFAPDDLADPQSATQISSIAGCSNFTANDSVRYDVESVPQSVQGGGAVCAGNSASPGIAPMKFFGGPPLWPSPAGFGQPLGFTGWTSGFSIFVPCADATCSSAAPPIAGSYTLGVAVPAGGADPNAYTTTSSTASLPQAQVAAPLPALGMPSVRAQADGTGIVSVNVPADPRIYETIVYVSVPDCGNAFVAPVGSEPIHYYAAITKSPGPQSILLSNLGPPGPNGQPTHTFCNAADAQALAGISPTPPKFSFTAVAVSFDYPAFEASYPANRQTAPAIASASSNTADLTISPPFSCVGYTPPVGGASAVCNS